MLPQMSTSLTAHYEQLRQLDRALFDAEQDLMAAHRKLEGHTGRRPEIIYQEVLGLRARSRQLLETLGEQLAGSP